VNAQQFHDVYCYLRAVLAPSDSARWLRCVGALYLSREATALRLVAPLYNYQPPRTLAQAMRDLKWELNR
jgi:hypothetical protein